MRHPGATYVPPQACLKLTPKIIADLKLKVITPMFGGGAQTGESDELWPIRPPAIRGQLRFWWRACNARRFSTASDMYEEESQIWGAATDQRHPQYGPGAIDLSIEITRGGDSSFYWHDRNIPFKLRGWHHGRENDLQGELPRGPQLAMFSFSTDAPAQVGRENVEFCLRVTLAPHVDAAIANQYREAAAQALWAWITFGGVGARTRRGCGSLQCLGEVDGSSPLIAAKAFIPNNGYFGNWLKKSFSTFVSSGTGLPLVPALSSGRVLISGVENDSIEAWAAAVNPMQNFRQAANIGRNPGHGPRPGQSRWPEPGAVRHLGHIPAGHGYVVTAGADGRDFPRADFGLPILFQNMRGKYDPKPTLEGSTDGAQRMASPIILKPVSVGGKFYPIAILLNAPYVWDSGVPPLHLKNLTPGTPVPLGNVGPMNHPTTPPHWPWPGRPPRTGGLPSARDAFVKYLEKDCGWTEVVP